MIPRRYVAAIMLLILAVHVQALFGPLLYDDAHAVTLNDAIKDIANVPAFFVDPGLFSRLGRMYRPLVLTSLACDHALGGGAAWAFKLDNLVQHLLACWLLFLCLPRLFGRAGLAARTARRATIAAVLLFGLHPLHVESLCLVSSRSELLAAIGFLVALQGWLRSKSPGAQGAWLAAGTAIACLAKETGILVPPAILLVDYLLPRAGGIKAFVTRFLPAMPVLAAYLVLRKAMFGVATTGMRTLVTGGDPFSGGTRDLATQLESMTLFLPKAVMLWLFPGPLSLDHTAFYGRAFSDPTVIAGALFVLACVLLGFCVRRSRPLVSLGIGGALAFALPWILIPLNVPLAEHRLYLPVLFFTIPAAAWIGRSLETSRAAFVRVATAMIVVAFGARTAIYERAWVDKQRVWSVALRANPQSFRALSSLADVAIERGELWRALRLLIRSRGIYARYHPAMQNYCEVRVRLLSETDSPRFAAKTIDLVESYAEERWKDPFVRLLAARAHMGRYRVSRDERDVRSGVAWALSCLAMVDPKMLVYRTAAEVHRAAREFEAALALFDASEARGLANRDFYVHEAGVLVAAGDLPQARQLIAKLAREQPADATLIAVIARYHAAADEPEAWQAACRRLRALGYDTSALRVPPSLAPAGPK